MSVFERFLVLVGELTVEGWEEANCIKWGKLKLRQTVFKWGK